MSESDNVSEIIEVYDIKDLKLKSKERIWYKITHEYYSNLNIKYINIMVSIVEQDSRISLRLLEWVITKYSLKMNICYFLKLKDESGNETGKLSSEKINLHISYKSQLRSFKKKNFDPFRRRADQKFLYKFKNGKRLPTTIGQLNFFKWAISNDVIDYVMENYDALSSKMIMSKLADKKKKNNKSTSESSDIIDKSEASNASSGGNDESTEKASSIVKSETASELNKNNKRIFVSFD